MCEFCPAAKDLWQNQCEACGASESKIEGVASCSLCTSSTYTDTTGQTSCKTCAEDVCAYEHKTSAMTIRQTSHASACCVCEPGWYQISTDPPDPTCRACPDGTYKIFPSNSLLCEACPANSGSLLPATSRSACRCRPDYKGSVNTACTECASGTYNNIYGNTNCTACSPNTGSVCESDCQCQPGYGGNSSTGCTICASRTYKGVYGNIACFQSTACPVLHVSAVGKTAGKWQKCNLFSGKASVASDMGWL